MTAGHAALLQPDWPAPAMVRAVSTLRRGAGVSQAPFDAFNLGAACGDMPDAVAANRARLRQIAALPSAPRWLRQMHGIDVLRFDGDAALREPADPLAPFGEADAAVTSTPGVVLAILTADCLPVLFAARDGSAIAAAHAGWRGLAAGVLEATVAAMRVPGGETIAWIGPAAGAAAYEVGDAVRDVFVAADGAAARRFVATRPGHWLMDLAGLARDRLAALGIAQVSGGESCTLSDPARFFSHRRDGRGGRMATLAWLQP
ncbi:peptidoglycan editing factor PgeF [Chiayiivirga flava]|uniref:Purine nucleoside phosphorylase n=1 Tax=Chiayiivirga flava TaxID=659595 RepID=A0A7W8D6S7_9GAMM|nr:peptidoglycan editing factor PgeF [Chiayiivirga flava]MBB5208991.1 hypothetical protein [Chiayiivirga flava]